MSDSKNKLGLKKGDPVICIRSYFDKAYRMNDPEEGWTGWVDCVSEDGSIVWVMWTSRGYTKSVSIDHLERIDVDSSGWIDTERTELVHRILGVFDDEMKNTPDFVRRRYLRFNQVSELIKEYMKD